MTTPPPSSDPVPAVPPAPPVLPAAPAVPAVSMSPVSPASAAVVAPGRGTPTWVNVALVAALAVAVGGVAFAMGRMSASSPTLTGPGGLVVRGQGPDGPDGGPMAPGGPGRIDVGGGLSIDGTVTAIDGDTLTITTDTGETQTIALDDTTTYRTATEGTSDDITVGDTVEVGVGLDGSASSGDTPTLTADDVTLVP